MQELEKIPDISATVTAEIEAEKVATAAEKAAKEAEEAEAAAAQAAEAEKEAEEAKAAEKAAEETLVKAGSASGIFSGGIGPNGGIGMASSPKSKRLAGKRGSSAAVKAEKEAEEAKVGSAEPASKKAKK